MTYSPNGVEATAVELQDSTRKLCSPNEAGSGRKVVRLTTRKSGG